MTPNEKAKELIHKYLQVYDGRVIQAKQCALIAVDEILSYHPTNYWLKVKKEIEKL